MIFNLEFAGTEGLKRFHIWQEGAKTVLIINGFNFYQAW